MTSFADALNQFSLWCITKAPLIISTDLPAATKVTIDILGNRAAIAVNQDSLGIPGHLVQNTDQVQVWTGPLSGGRYAAALVNLDDTEELKVKLDWSQLPGTVPTSQQLQVHDLWNASASLGTFSSSIELRAPPHGCRLLVLEQPQ